MPGLFDNSPGPSGGILGGLTATLFPGIYHQQIRDQAQQAYKDAGFSDSDAALAANNPNAFQNLWQQRLFQAQLQEQRGSNPSGSLTEALYNIQHPEEIFKPQPFGEYHDPSGASGPGIRIGKQITPPFSGFNTPPGPQVAGAPSIQPQPSQQPAASAPTMTERAIKFKSDVAGAEELARKQADALQQYPNALTNAQTAVSRLEALRDDPDLPSIVGGTLGVKGRSTALGQRQAELVNEVNELQSKIIGNTLTATRSVSGRPVSPGALKELSVGAGDLIAARKGTVEGMKKVINNSIDLIKNETQAAWEGTGKKGNEPSWGAAPNRQQPPAPAVAALKANPHLSKDFDAKYGNGAAMRVLGQ